MDRNKSPSLFARVMSRTTSVPHSVHLGKLDDQQLSRLHDSLIFEHDAHDGREWDNGVRTRPVSRELIVYLRAVKVEMMIRTPTQLKPRAADRFETRRPVNILKRAAETIGSQGSMSLGDLQTAYHKI